MKNKPGFLSFPSISKEFAFQVIDDYVKTLNYNMRSMEQTIERGKGMPDESIITQNAATFFIRQIDKQLEKLSIDMARKTVKGRTTGIEYNLGKDYYDTLASLRGELLAAKQALGEITTAKLMSDIEMNIPDTVVDTSTGGGGGKPGVFSMKDQAKQLYESLLGQNIYETTKELQDKLLADINAIKENIEKSKQDGSTQLDEIDTEYYLNIAERMIKGDRYVQLFEEGTNTITKIFENAKRLKDSGLFKEAEAEFNRASEIKDSFEELMKNWGGENQAIISLLDSFPRNRHPVLMYGDDAGKIPAWNTQSAFEKLFKTDYEKIVERGFIGTREQWEELQGMTLSEIEAFKRDIETFEQNTKTAIIQFQSTFMSGAREALSDEDFINLALEHFEINTDVTKNWDELRKAIEEAEKEGFVAKSEFLKFIADNTMTAYKDFLAKMFDLDQPEYVKDAISAIKSKIDNDKIVDKKVIQAMIDKVIEKLLDMGQTVSDKDRDAITKGVMPENAETKGFDWKSAVGIADYENDNEAILDISKQAVSQLQAVWSFYWDWEIKQLQKQHDKKLGLLEDEKNIMLANENMSAQQRAIIEERFEEKKKAIQKKLDKEMAAKKKKQAIFDASIDFARGLIGIWSSELSKGIFGLATAPILTGLLSGIFATQLALINNQKFARGGYTGSGVGSPDETGYRPAGIVHEGELVIDKKTLDRGNLNPLMSIYQAMKSGQSFDSAAANYLMGNLQTKMPRPINSGMFAGGGYVGKNRSVSQNQEITIDFKGMKVLDPVELNRLVIDVGGKKRRKIGE